MNKYTKAKKFSSALKGWETRRAKVLESKPAPAKIEEKGKNAFQLLTEASAIVDGSRSTTHGEKERSFEAIAALWNTYLSNRVLVKDQTSSISSVDVANMMALLKIARSIQGKPIADHYIDGAGYLAIAGEIALT